MNRFFAKTFYKFFFSFLVIIAIAFGVMLVASSALPRAPVDSVASPQ